MGCVLFVVLGSALAALTWFALIGLAWLTGISPILAYVVAVALFEVVHRAVGHKARWITRLVAPTTLLPFFLYYIPMRSGDPSDDWAVVLALPAYFVARYSYFRLWKTDDSSYQDSLDRAAEKLRKSIHLDNIDATQKYVLYLRPFISTARLPTQALSQNFRPSQHSDFELVLREAILPNRLLIALGVPGETEGAARMLTGDDTWWHEFTVLAARADLIIVLPAANDGTYREISWLRENGRLRKCIFYMPETPPVGGGLEIHKGPKTPFVRTHRAQPRVCHQCHWEAAVERLVHLGIRLPYYDRCGALFKIGDDGCLASNMGWLQLSREAFKVSRLRTIVRDIESSSGQVRP